MCGGSMPGDYELGASERTGLVWLRDIKENGAWYEALYAIDRHGDKQPLVKLLQSGQTVPPSIAFYLGDLLDRYQLKHRKARPALPGYLRSADQIDLIAAIVKVGGMVHQDGIPLAEAMQKVAAESGIDKAKLRAAYTGKHGGLQRAQRRWYRPRP
jgi:hypothetical protein